MKIESYNNIGISLIGFLSVIRHFESIDFSKALLIQPFTLHNQMVTFLKDRRIKINGMDDLLLSRVNLFLNFNDRYFSLLTLSMNMILLSEKMGFIKILDDHIFPIVDTIEKIDFTSTSLGKRAKKIVDASNTIHQLLQEDTKELYFKLRIEL